MLKKIRSEVFTDGPNLNVCRHTLKLLKLLAGILVANILHILLCLSLCETTEPSHLIDRGVIAKE